MALAFSRAHLTLTGSNNPRPKITSATANADATHHNQANERWRSVVNGGEGGGWKFSTRYPGEDGLPATGNGGRDSGNRGAVSGFFRPVPTPSRRIARAASSSLQPC